MNEIEITSGRMNPHIDPHLTIWGWEIPVYLFIGGLVAGILFFSALYYIRGSKDKYPTAVKVAPLFALPLLGFGMFALFLDLSHKLYVFRFYTAFRLESPMSWGSWTLLAIMPLSLIWSLIWVEELWPKFQWPLKWITKIIDLAKNYKKIIAWSVMILAIILGMYTGILLSAFNARPFWNTSILGPLFLTSGMSTGAALILLLSKSEEEKKC